MPPGEALDHDAPGLRVFAEAGAFILGQSSPKRPVPKVYVATTHDPLTSAQITVLNEGVQLIDEPAPIAGKARQLDTHCLEIVLEQGKYHQVKRMLAAAGNHCSALRRTAIGGLTLESLSLAQGEWCYITQVQRERLVA